MESKLDKLLRRIENVEDVLNDIKRQAKDIKYEKFSNKVVVSGRIETLTIGDEGTNITITQNKDLYVDIEFKYYSLGTLKEGDYVEVEGKLSCLTPCSRMIVIGDAIRRMRGIENIKS